MRRYRATDRLIGGFAHALATSIGPAPVPAEPNPAGEAPDPALDEPARRHAAGLMRINHAGEVCAQALYLGQAAVTRSAELQRHLVDAAAEEADHLAWCAQRLDELGARPSLLNPLWYAGAFGIGLLAGRLGDAASLAFVVETERQVEAHLAGHLDRLAEQDAASRRIVERMQADERAHAERAEQAGAATMPAPARWLMRAAAKVMTTTAHHI
jgi:ubiquinone biosynthesis monooxygenase Coq7